MNIFKWKKKPAVKQQEERTVHIGGLSFNTISNYSQESSKRLSAVYAATNQISNSVALLPVDITEVQNGNKKKMNNHPLCSILNLKPNARMPHFCFFKRLMEDVMLNGEAFAYINRDDDLNVTSLDYISPDLVTPNLLADGTVKYFVSGVSKAIDSVNMLHFYLHCDSQMRGISVIKYASNTLQSSFDAEHHSENFFKSGANLSGVLKASAVLTNDQKKQIKDNWASAFNSGSDSARVAILPAGLDYQPISVNPEDSQLLESRKYNVIEIARFFNISPAKLFDYSNISYGSLEQSQLSYLQDTIYPYVRMIEDEMNLKLFKPSEFARLQVSFDFATLMSTDKATEASYYKELLTNGILSLNEVRNKLGFSSVDGGDKHYMQLSYTTTEMINNGTLSNSQEQTEQTQDNQIDNNVKRNSNAKTIQRKRA